MKRKLLLAACLVAGALGFEANASTDITSTYLTNADLSTVDNGWTYYSDAFKYTDWKTDGDVPVVEFYSQWNNGAPVSITQKDFKFSQTVTMPAGYYRLAVNAFYRNGSGDGTNDDKAWIFVKGTGIDKSQNVVALTSAGVGGYTGSNDLYKAANAFSRGDFSNAFDFKLTEGTEVEIGFQGFFNLSLSWCILGPVKLYEYTAEDYMGDYRTKVAEAEALYSSPMNSTVLTNLKAAVVDEATLVTVDDVFNAVDNLKAAIANAEISILKYAEAKTILDAANIYDATGQASYAADETIAAIQSAYDEGTLEAVTTEQKTAANAALATACKAQTQPANNCDMTAYIVNPGIDGNVDGWTCSMEANGGYVGGPLKPSNDAMEFWGAGTLTEQDNGKSFDYYQTITGLPEGAYTISAEMLNSTNGESGASWNGGGKAGLYGKTASAEVQKLITTDGETFLPYTTDEILVIDGNLRLGVKNVAALTGRWFAADNFKLTYVRQLTAEEEEVIAKENAVALYNEALAAAQAIVDGTIPADAYTTLQGVIDENTLADGTSTEYNAATTALNEATAAATPLVAPYAAWKTLKTQADALVAVTNDNATANGTLSSAISDENTTVEAATTADAITGATATLKAAMITYAGAANPVGEGKKFDLTFMLTNANLEGLPTWEKCEGWTTEQADGNYQVMKNDNATSEDGTKTAFYEYWSWNAKANDKFNLYTAVTLPEGTYTMSCYAFAKQQDGEAGKDPVTGVYFYANDTQGDVVSDSRLTQKSISFVNTTEQEVKIGLKALSTGNTYNWMGIGYVELYKVPAQTYTVDETVAYDYSQSGAGAVTLNRTIKVGYNSVVLPFSMTQEEVESTFGTDSKVYVVSKYENENLSFVTQSGITPNRPCLLYATKAGTSYEIEDRTIVAAASAAPSYTSNNATMTGCYAASITVDNGNYVLAKDELHLVDSSVSLKNTRAYITLTEAEGAKARVITMSFDDSEATGIATIKNGTISIETGTIYNLNGQRVTAPTKGIYIVNGKKVLFK